MEERMRTILCALHYICHLPFSIFHQIPVYDSAMPQVDVDRLIWIVVGIQLNAELGDRPLAQRVEQAMREKLLARLGKPDAGEPPKMSPVVITDVYYLNDADAQARPAISVGGPGVNALSALLTDKLPTPVAIEDTLVVQMDLDFKDRRCAVWGMTHLDTVRAVELFLGKGYLDMFLDGVVKPGT
jgi:hypothetical protein